RKVITNFLNKGRELYEAGHAKTGRKKKVSDRRIRAAGRLLTQGMSTKQVSQQTRISKATIGRRVKGVVKFARYRHVPALKQRDYANHFDYANANLNKDWRNVVFTDEKSFRLKVKWHGMGKWIPSNDPRRVIPNQQSQADLTRSVMVWGAFANGRPISIARCPKKMKAVDYTALLQQHYLPVHPQGSDFLQDNSPVHKARHSMAWMRNNNLNLIDHPPRSPDLNPIENAWGYLVHKVYDSGRKTYRTEDELWAAVQHEFMALDGNYLTTLGDSMPRRLQSVIDNNGGHTKY
ncbi:MAG: transposase, partial [Halobacteriota archaeon]|nr:transposase [Halobacteriota archaeon]